MAHRVAKYVSFLEEMLDGDRRRYAQHWRCKTMLRIAESGFIHFLCDIVYHILQENAPINKKQKELFFRFKDDLLKLKCKKCNINKKRWVLIERKQLIKPLLDVLQNIPECLHDDLFVKKRTLCKH